MNRANPVFTQYPLPITDAYMKEIQGSEKVQKKSNGATFTEAEIMGSANDGGDDGAEADIDTPDVPLRASEKKRLHWKGLTCASSRVHR